MNDSKVETRAMPRVVGYLEWIYLREALKVTEKHFESELAKATDDNTIRNLNGTRQSLYRAAFISILSTLEQNLDEKTRLKQEKQEIKISPSDLKHRGVKRSVVYARKVLGIEIDEKQPHWKELEKLQELRNQLVHYGPTFPVSEAGAKLREKLDKSDYVSFNPAPCFSDTQLRMVIDLAKACIKDFRQSDEST